MKPHEMTREEYDTAQAARRRDILEAWNNAGCPGFPPPTGHSIYDVIALAERAGYDLPADAERVLGTPYHQLLVEAALSEGGCVPDKNLKRYGLTQEASDAINS